MSETKISLCVQTTLHKTLSNPHRPVFVLSICACALYTESCANIGKDLENMRMTKVCLPQQMGGSVGVLAKGIVNRAWGPAGIKIKTAFGTSEVLKIQTRH